MFGKVSPAAFDKLRLHLLQLYVCPDEAEIKIVLYVLPGDGEKTKGVVGAEQLRLLRTFFISII